AGCPSRPFRSGTGRARGSRCPCPACRPSLPCRWTSRPSPEYPRRFRPSSACPWRFRPSQACWGSHPWSRRGPETRPTRRIRRFLRRWEARRCSRRRGEATRALPSRRGAGSSSVREASWGFSRGGSWRRGRLSPCRRAVKRRAPVGVAERRGLELLDHLTARRNLLDRARARRGHERVAIGQALCVPEGRAGRVAVLPVLRGSPARLVVLVLEHHRLAAEVAVVEEQEVPVRLQMGGMV